IEFSTISGNVAGQDGGGIHVGFGGQYPAVAMLLGTIVAKNSAATNPDVAGNLVSRGENLIGDGGTTTVFTEPGDRVGTSARPIDPLLGPLADNGGPTRTQALAPNSPARDAVDCLGMIEDQRHEPRPTGTTSCDIGAFELPEP